MEAVAQRKSAVWKSQRCLLFPGRAVTYDPARSGKLVETRKVEKFRSGSACANVSSSSSSKQTVKLLRMRRNNIPPKCNTVCAHAEQKQEINFRMEFIIVRTVRAHCVPSHTKTASPELITAIGVGPMFASSDAADAFMNASFLSFAMITLGALRSGPSGAKTILHRMHRVASCSIRITKPSAHGKVPLIGSNVICCNFAHNCRK